MHSSTWLPPAATAAVTVLTTLTVASAPAPVPSDPANPLPVMEAFMADIDQVERKLVALAEAIPEDMYDWRPADGVRSFSEVLLHLAADNYFIPAATGVPAPESTGILEDSYESVQAYEGRTVSREQALAELRESFEHLDSAMGAVDEAALADTVELFGQEFTGLRLWVLTTTHLHEHLGQLIAYARTNGVAPPWSG